MKKYAYIGIFTMILVMSALSIAPANYTVAAQPVQPKDGVFTFAVADFKDGKARHYEYTAPNGTKIRFFLVKSKDGVIRSALDACEVCYRSKKGYVQSGNDMTCINCGLKFKTEKVGEFKGGCNPHPIKSTVQGDKITISQQEIMTGQHYFQ